MRRILPLCLLLVFVPAAPAVDHRVDLAYPAADHSNVRAAVGTGFAACGAGASGALCRTPGVMTAHAVPGVAIPAFSAADFVFTPPTGVTIAAAHAIVRYHMTDAGVHARILHRAGATSWTPIVLPDRTTAGTLGVDLPAGITQFAPSLYARTSVPLGRITSSTANQIEVQRLVVVLRDLVAPTVTLGAGAIRSGAWQRGVVCNRVEAADDGLGVFAVTAEVDGQTTSLLAPAGPQLQPRPRAFGGDLCVDTRVLHDGYLTAVVSSHDGPVAGGNRSAPATGTLLVDNSAPIIGVTVAATTTDQQPEVTVRAVDATSGLAAVTASVGGVSVALTPTGDGGWRGRPGRALAWGTYVVEARTVDAAGNAATAAASIVIADPTPAVVSDFAGGEGGFAVTITDPESGVARSGVHVALDGRDVGAAGDFTAGVYRYVVPQPLAPGRHAVRVQVVNGAGLEALHDLAFEIAAPPVVLPPIALAFTTGSVTVQQGVQRVVALRATRGAAPERGLRVTLTWADGAAAGSAVTDETGTADAILDGSREGTLVATGGDTRAELQVSLARGVTLTARRLARAVRLRGTITPRTAAVVIEAYAAGRWRAIRTVNVTRGGTFSVRVPLRRRGLYVFRATTGELRSPAVQVWRR